MVLEFIKKALIKFLQGALIAETKFRREFEERLKAVINELSKIEEKIILFIGDFVL